MPGVNTFTTTTDLGELEGYSTTIYPPIKHRLKIFTDSLKLPEGIQPFEGAEGLYQVRPRVGAILWSYNFKSVRLEAVRIIAPQGHYQQYAIWRIEWLTGPERGKFINDYERTYWLPISTTLIPAPQK